MMVCTTVSAKAVSYPRCNTWQYTCIRQFIQHSVRKTFKYTTVSMIWSKDVNNHKSIQWQSSIHTYGGLLTKRIKSLIDLRIKALQPTAGIPWVPAPTYYSFKVQWSRSMKKKRLWKNTKMSMLMNQFGWNQEDWKVFIGLIGSKLVSMCQRSAS